MKIREVLLSTDVKYSPALTLRAGKLTAIYEEGRIRYISFNKEELVRMIYPALRSADWTTIYPTITNERISIKEQSFLIGYTALYESGDIRYRAEYSIEGYEDSRIVFVMKGEALHLFQSKRIGLCVLHPMETCSGKEATLTRPDGSSYSAKFPEGVSPRQPFKNLRAIGWNTHNHGTVRIDLEGDVFETEDQRNWSDNSFKTYSRPSDLPAPFDVHPGETMEQSVSIQLTAGQSAAEMETNPVSELKFPLPKIGYARGKHQPELTVEEAAVFKQIPFDHYLVNILLGEKKWKETLKLAVQEAKMLGTKLLLNVLFSSGTEQELWEFIKQVAPVRDTIISVLLLSVNKPVCAPDFFAHAYAAIKNTFPELPTGYGTAGNFADLNRNRPNGLPIDFVSFHLQPQAHLSDSRTIIENLEGLPSIIQSAIAVAGNKPAYASPVTFCKPGSADDRLHTWFGAWWTLGAIVHLAGAERISLYELTGKAGLLHTPETSPVYKVLRTLKEFEASFIIMNTGNDIVFENMRGERLIFKSDFQNLINN